MTDSIAIGKIVRSESHVRYTCQVFGENEVAAPPEPEDYAFGSFVRIPLRGSPQHAALVTSLALPDVTVPPRGDVPYSAIAPANGARGQTQSWGIGLLYDTILVNPAFGTLGPRLSNDEQVALFSPDYLSERAVLVSILLLGTMTQRGTRTDVHHGVPPVAPDLGAEVVALADEHVRAFHSFADHGEPGGAKPYLHMGYLPHAIAQDNPLLPMAMLRTIERLERLFPENAALLSIVKRNFAWRLKVQTAG